MPRIKKAGTDKKKDATKQSSSDIPGAKAKRRVLGKSEECRARKPGISLRRWEFYLLTRNYARSPHGTRLSDLKPFYRGAKVTAIAAISIKKVAAVMTLNDSMDGKDE